MAFSTFSDAFFPYLAIDSILLVSFHSCLVPRSAGVAVGAGSGSGTGVAVAEGLGLGDGVGVGVGMRVGVCTGAALADALCDCCPFVTKECANNPTTQPNSKVTSTFPNFFFIAYLFPFSSPCLTILSIR